MNISVKSTLKMAFKSILSNKMRTFLTMLGIIIGVFSVIVMVSVGQGATASVTESIQGMGSNLLTLNIMDRNQSFKSSYFEELSIIEGIDIISPSITWSSNIKYGLNTEEGVSILGVNEYYTDIKSYDLSEGRFLNPLDIDNRSKVALIGSDTAESLFGQFSPINEKITLDGVKYTIVGVLKEKEESIAGSSNELVLIPYSTGMRQFSSSSIGSILIQAKSAETIKETQERIEKYLLTIFGSTNSYRIMNQEELLSTLNEITGTLTLMLGGIAGISLFVGGIGIMNIMLVTVSERTREIGIRKAIGARRSNILTQFLIESSVISCFGGIIGIIIGLGVNKILGDALGIKAIANIEVIALSFGFSLFVGIFFGMYPANKASKLKPVDALRYE
jgi:putative ABC transport system permease protein